MTASKVVIREFSPIELCEEDDEGANKVTLERVAAPPFTYWCRPLLRLGDGKRTHYDARWHKPSYNFVPIVLWSDGSQWAEACAFILSRLELRVEPNMQTLSSNAEDLAEFARFIEATDERLKDDGGFDWLDFPVARYKRPTYQFRYELGRRIKAGTMSVSRGRRCMSLVIRFYRWLIAECGLDTGSNAPWIDKDHYIEYKDQSGFSHGLVVTSTNLGISVRKANNPRSGLIQDGGQLRPLSHEEQNALISSLKELDNPEMRLICLTSLLTGARIQTVLTMRVEHVQMPLHGGDCVTIKAGPGTGIDTKFNVKGVLHIDMPLYEQLKTYAACPRAVERRTKAPGGDNPEQYLFLTNRGLPFYESKEDSQKVPSERGAARTQKVGNTIRKFWSTYLIPMMQRKLQRPNFGMHFHDLRATFGLNYADTHMPLVNDKKMSYDLLMRDLADRMWHKSTVTTEHYLKYRERNKFYEEAAASWSAHVSKLSGE